MNRRNSKTSRYMRKASASVPNVTTLDVVANDNSQKASMPSDIPQKRKIPEGLTNWLKSSLVSVIALLVSFSAYQNARLARTDSLAKDARERSEKMKLNKQHVYQCYLLGKQLWEVEGEYVLFKDRRNRFDLPSDVAQTLVVQQAEQTAHDLDLDVTATIEAIYNSKKVRTYDQVTQNHYTEKGIEAAADILSGRIKAKYSEEAQTAFQVGRDVGWVLFLNKAYTDHEVAAKQFFLKHPKPGVDVNQIGGGMTGPLMETLQRLNKQMKLWGLTYRFGHTAQIGKPDGSVSDYTFPNADRSEEIVTFVAKIEDYLRN